MKLNLDKNLLDLKGCPIKEEKLNDIMANILAMSNVGKPAKMITWAVNLTNNGEIEIDAEEAKFLKDLIEKTPQIVNLAKAQLIEEIEKLQKD
jgi:replicative DNA helicase